MMTEPKVAVVNNLDEVTGAAPLDEVVARDLIHRIVRIILRNSQGQILVVQRSKTENAWPGRWGESVAGHVDEGEDYAAAGAREIGEEIGLSGVPIKAITTYYQETVNTTGHPLKRFNGLFEAVSDRKPKWNEKEVAGGRWVSSGELFDWMKDKPDEFVPAALKAFEVYQEKLSD